MSDTAGRTVPDGVHAMVPREKMSPSARKLRDTYARVPNASLFQREFGYYCLERWGEQGMPQGVPLDKLFHYDPPGNHTLGQLGWCEAAFDPLLRRRLFRIAVGTCTSRSIPTAGPCP
jgi:hypothetical protein